MREKKLQKNTLSSLFLQITTIICGLVLPRLILRQYGSAVNGLVNSITQFMQFVVFLELGVGTVVQSALYEPLATKNLNKISEIIASADKFFKGIAKVLVVYIVILIIVYPYVVIRDFEQLYTVALIITIGISFFAQYYWGIVDRLLLIADQRGFVQYNIQTITLLINTWVCACLICAGTSIQLVKLIAALVYVLRPIWLRIYVNRNYNLNRRIAYQGEPIKQKWNGIAQHIAAVILDNTDTVVLALFSTLANVSIYSVYHLVVYGIKRLLFSMTNGIQALVGELWAKKEIDTLKNTFEWMEWIIHTVTIYVFGCAGMLLLPFVKVYTLGITDADYYQPIFAVLIVLANAGHCLRLPYNIMILAGGHYKQTQRNYIIASISNIVISIVTVKMYGLIGVTVGTLLAMLYQTIWMAHYNSKNFVNYPMKKFIKQMLVDAITAIAGVMLTKGLEMEEIAISCWINLSIQVAIIWLLIVMVVNFIFYKNKIENIFRKGMKIFIK